MVRIKHRYLLIDILYPTTTTTSPPTPTHLTFHAPTPDTFKPGLLAKLLRERVAFLYGDWGVGKLGGSGANGVSGKKR
jgi:ribonuclease P/MRP protein subunit POP5